MRHISSLYGNNKRNLWSRIHEIWLMIAIDDDCSTIGKGRKQHPQPVIGTAAFRVEFPVGIRRKLGK